MTDKDTAIKIDNLTKIYKLYNAPIDRLKESLHWRGKKYHKDFYALNDVSFEIKRGECVGILGKNGAGKSTLLKIITGVLTPTSGNITVNGKVSALLELGAGFNPEYTGLENIYFQGAIMGYDHSEIEAKVDEILAFADIGEFINQPYKTYSSGMGARLAFAVAINIDPEILIVDEALSVGDMAFQNKCMRHMEKIMKSGVTVIFVSHDIQALKKFCSKAIWLKDGQKYMDGKSGDVTKKYMAYSSYGIESNEIIVSDISKVEEVTTLNYLIPTIGLESFGDGKARILKVGFFDQNGNLTQVLLQGIYAIFVCEIEAYEDLYDVGIGVMLKDYLNNEIITFNSYMYSMPLKEIKAGEKYMTKIKFKVPKIFPRQYIVTVALSDGTQMNHNQQHWIYSATTIDIKSSDMIDACFLTLYQDEVEYMYEQI